MSDIVDKLRGYYVMSAGEPMFRSDKKVHKAADLHEAAETILALRKEVEGLREARSLLQYARPLVGIARSMSDSATADSARLLCQRIDAFLSDISAALATEVE